MIIYDSAEINRVKGKQYNSRFINYQYWIDYYLLIFDQ